MTESSSPLPHKLLPDRQTAGLTSRPKPIDLPPSYPEQLALFADEYRQSDKLPDVDVQKLYRKPKDKFRMFPAKCRRALSLATANAKLVFLALWDQHEEKKSRANGILIASFDWLSRKTSIYNRNQISAAIVELEVRGIIRTKRGRGGNGTSHPNLFLLTAFPDCLGNPPTVDYESRGLPESTLNEPKSDPLNEHIRRTEAIFNARIEAQVQLVKHFRQMQRNAKAT
ncbi:MAG: hypothetical protein JSR78_04085 [Proteobacteria bacterium]|nr:hypothetical protein [Pseudomonadota bacterium]